MKDYKIKISPRMLELLSRDLYTNMYFVLAELIANAYDADAENVYLFFSKDEIKIEDDGIGMDENILDSIYLNVGGETRTDSSNEKTPIKKRMKMGRKGIGKLSALSISNGFKLITVQNNKKIGIYIPKKIEKENENLKVLQEGEYKLDKIVDHGTAIIMENPIVTLPKTTKTIVRNLSKIFPTSTDDFKIHIFYEGKWEDVKFEEYENFQNIASLITIGEDKKYLLEKLPSDNLIQKDSIDEIKFTVEMQNKNNVMSSIDVNIKGWIATYKTTKGMKNEILDFSDNYLAIFSHNKMGLRNVLDIVGKNRVAESYIVGNLYIDAFEDSDFPDMASTNRQGYNESDPRWQLAVIEIRKILDKAVKLHTEYTKKNNEEKAKQKLDEQRKQEKELKDKLDNVSKTIKKNITQQIEKGDSEVEQIVDYEIERMKPILELKSTIDANKKKIMISQTMLDKPIADIVYNMLLFNNVDKNDIIYSNSDDPEANLPETNIYDYLRDFFVDSASTKKIFVLFVTSKNVYNNSSEGTSASWGVLMEIGAAWITKQDHWIFNINGFTPLAPLNITNKWVSIYTNENGNISLSMPDINSFCKKIISTCLQCGYVAKDFEANKKYLMNFIELYEVKVS